MNKTLIALTALGMIGASAISVAAFDGNGYGRGQGNMLGERPGYQQMLEDKADLLGVSVEDVEAARAEGTSFGELAEELGISIEDMQARMLERAKERVQERVDSGAMTEGEAADLLTRMQERHENCDGEGMGRGKGFGGQRGGGFGKSGLR
jgi:hypothetical protein